MKYMKVSVLILTIIAGIFAVLFSLQVFAGKSIDFALGIFMIVVLFFFVLSVLLGIFGQKFSLKRLGGFYLLHFGLIMFLAGCYLYYLFGSQTTAYIPVANNQTYSQIGKSDGSILELGFDIGVSDFRVDKYDDGSDKFYEATLMIFENSDVLQNASLSVNNPYQINGFDIYLMSYKIENVDGVPKTYVSVMFKTDPGKYLSFFGIWAIIIGTFVTCLVRPRKAGENP